MELADDVVTGQQIDPATYVPKTLRSQVQGRKALPFEQCVELGLSLTAALSHLHGHGLIHRDIKPSNIIFVNGIPKLADIGLVAEQSEAKSFVGTEGFIPPEGPGTPQADIYSLGKVLYEIATGKDRHEFPALPTMLGDSATDSHLLELNSVFLKACQNNIAQRYQSTEQMRNDLLLLQSGKSVKRAQVLERRLAVLTRFSILGASVAVILIVIVLLFRKQALNEAALRRRAEAGESAARQNLYAADMFVAQQALRDRDLGRAIKLLNRHKSEAGKPDVRNWEWRYLWKLSRSRERFTLCTFSNAARAVHWFPDGGRLLVTDVDGNLSVWDVQKRREMSRAAPVAMNEDVAAISPDGQTLAIATHRTNAGVLFYETRTLREIASPLALNKVEALAFASDGQRLFTVARGLLETWSMIDHRWLCRQVLPLGEAESPLAKTDAFSDDQSLVVLDQSNGALVIWDSILAKERAKLDAPFAWIRATFSPDGKRLAASFRGNPGPVFVWGVEDGQRLADIRAHTSWVPALDFSPDGHLLATGGYDQILRLWNTETWEQVGERQGHLNEIWDLSFSPDGASIATASKDGTVRLWDAQIQPTKATRMTLPASVKRVVFSPDGGVFMAADQSRFEVYDALSLRIISSGAIPVTNWLKAAVSSHGSAVAFSAADGSIEILKGRTWPNPRRFRMVEGASPDLLAFAPSGEMIASGDFNTGLVQAFDIRQGTALKEFSAHGRSKLECLAFSPDSLLLATGSSDRTAKLWEVRSGRPVATFQGHKDRIISLAFSRDGRLLATTSTDGTGRVWDTRTATQIAIVRGQLTSMFAAAFSPDGERLATGNGDGPIRLYNFWRDQELATLGEKDLGAGSAIFFLNDDTIVALNGRVVSLWQAASQLEIDRRENFAGH